MFAKRKTCVPRIAYNVKLAAKRIYVKLNPQLSILYPYSENGKKNSEIFQKVALNFAIHLLKKLWKFNTKLTRERTKSLTENLYNYPQNSLVRAFFRNFRSY